MSGVVTVSRALTPRNWTAATDPTNAWDAGDGVRVGDFWYNTASGNTFYCVSNAVGAAVWRHIPRALAVYGTAVTHTGNTNETVLATIAVPAGAVGSAGFVRVRTVWTVTNNANNKTRRVRYGASGAGTGGTVMMGIATASTASMQHFVQWTNRQAQNSQVGAFTGAGTGGWAEGSSGAGVASIDSSAATEIAITGQLATGTDSITLESYSVEILRPDIV